jgi:transcriptional regulator with XRE-family HTH domain
MAGPVRPTTRRIELGYELRKLREQAGLTREQAVRGLRISESKLQRIETGLQDARTADNLRKLLSRYGVTDDDAVEQLLEIQRAAASREWWTQYKGFMPSGMPRFVGIESAAVEIRAFHPVVILGLLQTESYARALYEIAKPIKDTTGEFVQRNVELRMRRKDSLTRQEDPLRLWAILYEPALRYVVGSADVMREQYDEIIKLASLANVAVQILPQSVRGYVSPHDFTLLDLGSSLPNAVQVDGAGDGVSVTDKHREVAQYQRKFESMARAALPAEDTPEFLHRLSREINQ